MSLFGGRFQIALLAAVSWLAGVGGVDAVPSERAEPPSAWWKAADLALARGDCARALALLNAQVAEGHYGAVARLGDIHESGMCADLSLPPAPQFYDGLIARGVAIAKARLGRLYLEGRGVPRNPARARWLFKEAVLQLVAHEFPERRRGAIEGVMSGHGVPAELGAELDWAERIEAGPPRLQYETALRLRTGDGLPRHEEAAYAWLREAALGGLPEAWYEQGRWDLTRAESEQDRRWALGRIARAAKAGHVAAIREIGLRLVEGRGVVRDDYSGYVLLLKARAAGARVEEALAAAASRLSNVEREVAALEARNPRFLFALGFPDD